MAEVTTPLPSRESMIEVAEYLEALTPKSRLLGRGALIAIAQMLRERSAFAPSRMESAND